MDVPLIAVTIKWPIYNENFSSRTTLNDYFITFSLVQHILRKSKQKFCTVRNITLTAFRKYTGKLMGFETLL